MYLFTLAMKQATILVPFVVFLSVTALPPDLRRRADPNDPCLNETPTLDGLTSDKSAGIGVEFEVSAVVFSKPGCSPADTNQAKGQQVGDRKGDNWQLTADTTSEIAGLLNAEYILNGKTIKVGTGAASAAAAAVSSDIIAWSPYSGMPNNQWNIEGNNCNPWAISNPGTGNSAGDIGWSTQVTAPLPFEAINDLFAAALVTPVTSPLLPSIRPSNNIVSATQKFFQSSPNGISPDSVKADVLGFFSLVISYAKKATPTSPPNYMEKSPKFTISIMPRTEFVTLYAQVKSTLPGTGTLYNLVKILACYKNDEDEDVELDPQFCGGTVAAPEPNSYMDGIGWCLKNTDTNDQDCLTVEDWMTSIASGSSPDKLTKLDGLIDGQIGGLGTALENIIDSTRAVPLFEFRNLAGVKAGKMQDAVSKAEQAVITYFNKYKTLPQRKMAKRQNDVYGCPTTSPPSSTTPTPTPSCTLQNEDPDQGIAGRGCICGSTTLPLLTVPSATDPAQSCAYTAIPTTNGTNPVSILSSTYTSACQACTLVGGIADTPMCTTIAGCATSTPTPAPASTSPPPTCSVGFYGTDTSCGGKCNGANAKCECIEAGYESFNEACTCTC
ncbi:hypothetical protein LPUS_10336 [Lasallia pustulata]|uniref:Uncharacterized protein n=1 Tax=Lasallia pustulata TaxID=136370 RepID=A0A1W5D9W8_9LECA|nr:hypothetical protein LPUS_10336 [Lasallia pustulata]